MQFSRFDRARALLPRRRGFWRTAIMLAWLACAPASGGRPEPISTPVAGRSGAELAPSDTAGYELPARAADRSTFPPQPVAPVAAETRLVRLSHSQYQHTVRDLLGTDELELALAPDARGGFGFETSNALRVDSRLGPQYRALAEGLAARAVTAPVTRARIVPCDEAAPSCRDEFLRVFGERAFRRPLTPADLDTFGRVFEDGAERFRSGNAFQDGVRLTLEVMLQAPEFLYRVEAPPLDDFEIASRLSYFLYDSMPDAALLEAARAGRLRSPDQVEAEARRMLRDPRVLEKLVAFHEQAWELDRFARISPDPAAHPLAPKGLVPRVRYATRLFITSVLQSGGGLTELLTAPYAYADAGLLPLYGGAVKEAPASSRRFARVELDPSERQGLLLQVGFLAANAYSVSTDPIHRGLFVIRNLLCREVPDPPPGATTTPPPETHEPIRTTRDEVSLVTGQSFCPTCHVEINAPGYAFEGFDAVGVRRPVENGVAVDTTGSMWLDGELVRFGGATELVQRLAQSREAHRCYSRRWLEFAYGRPLAESDLPTLEALAERSLPIADIISGIVRSPAFLSAASATAPDAAPLAEVSR